MGLGVLLRPSRAPFLGFHQPLCFLFTLLGSGSRLWGAPKHWIGPEPVALKRDPRRQFWITALDGGLNRLRGFDRNRSCRSWNRRGRSGHRGCVSRWDRAAADDATAEAREEFWFCSQSRDSGGWFLEAPSLRDSSYLVGNVNPTLKRGANELCASGTVGW